jgi:hypothetical protein
MIPDILPHPARSSITALRTFLCAGSDPSQGRPAIHRATEIRHVIVGYLFGKATKGSDTERKPGGTGTTRLKISL